MLETAFDKLLFTLLYKKRVQCCLMYHSFLCLGLLSKWTVLLTTIYDLSSKLLYSYIATYVYTPFYSQRQVVKRKNTYSPKELQG